MLLRRSSAISLGEKGGHKQMPWRRREIELAKTYPLSTAIELLVLLLLVLHILGDIFG